MLGSAILDVAIGVVFVYLWVSLICSSIREGIESWTKTRAAYLEYGIRQLLESGGQGLAQQLFEHPLIFGLYSGKYSGGATGQPGLLTSGKNLPSYIPARSFALTLLDLATHDAGAAQLLKSIDAPRGDSARAIAAIEAWYDSAMERVGGWYKRSSQWIIFLIALAIAVGGNFNTLRIADHLYRDEATRAVLVERSKVPSADAEYLKRSDAASRDALQELHLPIGWTLAEGGGSSQLEAMRKDVGHPLVALIGWLMTAFAATLGAPFWFDVLRKVMVIRATLKPSDDPAETRASPVAATSPPAVAVAANSSGPAPAIDADALAAALAALVARSAQNDVDSCMEHAPGSYEETPDEQLPPATGGVA